MLHEEALLRGEKCYAVKNAAWCVRQQLQRGLMRGFGTTVHEHFMVEDTSS
jgi:hypothetical protein